MISDVFIDGNRLTDLATIVGVDNLGNYDVNITANSVSWLPGGHFYGLEYGFYTLILYIAFVGDSYSELEDKRITLLKWINAKKKHNVTLETVTGLQLNGEAVILPIEGGIDAESQFLQKASLKFKFIYPLRANERTVTYTPSQTVGLVVPVEVPVSLARADDASVVSVWNNGNMWFYPEITIHGPIGGNVLIQNLTNGQELIVLNGISSGQVFTAKFDDNLVYKLNEGDASYMVEGSLPQLEIGENRFAISGKYVGTGAQVTIKYWDFYYGL